ARAYASGVGPGRSCAFRSGSTPPDNVRPKPASYGERAKPLVLSLPAVTGGFCVWAAQGRQRTGKPFWGADGFFVGAASWPPRRTPCPLLWAPDPLRGGAKRL